MEIGQLCMKIAGRDAGKIGVIIKIIDKNYVLLEGQVRRRKCNMAHLEILPEKVNVSKDAQRAEVKAALKPLKIELIDTKPKKAGERPRKQRKGKVKTETEVKKKQEKRVEKKTETTKSKDFEPTKAKPLSAKSLSTSSKMKKPVEKKPEPKPAPKAPAKKPAAKPKKAPAKKKKVKKAK